MLAELGLIATLVAAPPPPPPQAPVVAQGDFNGFEGAELWDAWSRWVRISAVETRMAAYEEAGQREGWRGMRDGPRLTSDTGYWNEVYQAGFIYLCDRNSEACEWVYRRARITAQPDAVHALAVETFDGDLLSSQLIQRGIAPGALPAISELRFEDVAALDTGLIQMLEVQRVSQTDCPAVASWSETLAAMPPLSLGGEASNPATRPPPYPIHVRHVITLPVEAYDGAEVTVEINGVRNPSVWAVWQALIEPMEDCG